MVKFGLNLNYYKMKKLILSAIAALPLFANAQTALPNGGFETWQNMFFYEEPQSWVSLNGQIASYNAQNSPSKPYSAIKSTDAVSGSFALRLVSVDITGANPLAGFLPDTAGAIMSGSVDFNTFQISGIPVNQKHAQIVFNYKYAPTGNDSANVSVLLTKWDVATQSPITIASYNANFGAQANYTELALTLDYMDMDNAPDTAFVIFSATSMNTPQVNSTVYIDNVRWNGVIDVGIEDQKAKTIANVFPNPADHRATVKVDSPEAQFVNVYTIGGKKIGSYRLQNEVADIDTKDFANGMYLVLVANASNQTLSTTKLSVKH
jgi:hypothetical protein